MKRRKPKSPTREELAESEKKCNEERREKNVVLLAILSEKRFTTPPVRDSREVG